MSMAQHSIPAPLYTTPCLTTYLDWGPPARGPILGSTWAMDSGQGRPLVVGHGVGLDQVHQRRNPLPPAIHDCPFLLTRM